MLYPCLFRALNIHIWISENQKWVWLKQSKKKKNQKKKWQIGANSFSDSTALVLFLSSLHSRSHSRPHEKKTKQNKKKTPIVHVLLVRVFHMGLQHTIYSFWIKDLYSVTSLMSRSCSVSSMKHDLDNSHWRADYTSGLFLLLYIIYIYIFVNKCSYFNIQAPSRAVLFSFL